METNPPKRAPEIAADLRSKILSGAYSGGEKFPRIRDLMVDYGVAAGTIDRAVKLLANEGLIKPRHGRGVTIRTPRLIRRNLIRDLRIEYERAVAGDESEGLFEAMVEDDGIADAKVTPTHAFIDAPDDVAEALDIEPGEPVLLRTFRYVVNDEPYQAARLYMRADLAERAGLPAAERKGVGSIAHLRNAGIDPDRATISIVTRRPTPDEAADLAIPDGTSAVQRTRRLYSDARPVELSITVMAADQVEHFLDIPLKGDPR